MLFFGDPVAKMMSHYFSLTFSTNIARCGKILFRLDRVDLAQLRAIIYYSFQFVCILNISFHFLFWINFATFHCKGFYFR